MLLIQARSVLAGGGIVAIDAPFGWPVPFVEAVERHRAGLPFGDTPSRSLRLRTTDQSIEGRPPLSVSSDRIAAVAFRAARLLDALGGVRRDGQDRVIEVYPAAALRRWKLELPGYKRDAGLRARIVTALATALPVLKLAGAADTLRRALTRSTLSLQRSLDGPGHSGLSTCRRPSWLKLR
jgi:Protein of unknown function (DUF429)